MNTGGRKDIKPSPPPSQEKPPSSDGLLTSDDLFGDMVDAPAEPREEPAPRKAPIRVQVSEPGKESDKSHRAPRHTGEVLPEDVAALLDAFSEPAEAAARAAALVPPANPPAPSAPPAPEPASPEAVDDDLGLLDALVEEAPAAPPLPRPPVVPRSAPRPALGPPAAAARVPHAPPRAARAPLAPKIPPPREDLVERELPLGETTPAPPWSRRSPNATAPGLPTDSLLDLPEIREIAARPPAPPPPPPQPAGPPQSRTGTKFQAAPADRKPVEERASLDLAALAEDAFAASAPPAPASPTPVPVPSKPAPGKAAQAYGPYALLEKVAVGGMAEVFRAKRSGVEGFEKVVAVKRILAHLSDNKEFVDMFVDEAKMVAGLTHPNIVQIFDLGKIEKTYYIAMEYVHGRDLRSIIKRAKERGIRIPLDLSVLIVTRVCAALEYAHRKKDESGRPMKIVHRDVSPQNILISFEGDVKLTDFGIAKAATRATTTERGALRGKLLYMSPEQAWGKAMDRRSDVFSLGIVFYEMVTDQKPFLANSEMSILEMVRDCRVAPPTSLNPRIPERLEKVIVKALERDPDQRYQDASEMARDMERALADRKMPTSAELARCMEVLFDPDERGIPVHDEHTSGKHRPGTGSHLEVELETTPARPGSPRKDEEPPAAAKDISLDKLLKRFGIK